MLSAFHSVKQPVSYSNKAKERLDYKEISGYNKHKLHNYRIEEQWPWCS
jgi:hypothetical protein